jgi:hypothetical protein
MQFQNKAKGDFGIIFWNVVINDYTHAKYVCPTPGGKNNKQRIFQLNALQMF